MKGFSAIIWRTKYNHPGLLAKSSWASNSAPIPMFEVSALSPVWNTYGQVTEVNLHGSANHYSGISWFGPQIPLLLLVAAVELTNLLICLRAMPAQWKQIKTDRNISAAQAILFIEAFGSSLILIELIDFMGQRHVLPMPVWLDFVFGASLLTFLSTFILGKAMFRAEVAIRGEEFGKKTSICLNVTFGLFLVSMIIAIVFMGWAMYQTDASAAIIPVFFVIFQGIAGVHFLRSKSRILKLLTTVQSTQEFHASQRTKDLQRMSFYLYFSAFFMLAYMVFLLLPGYAIIVGSTELMIYAGICTALFKSLSALSQLLSLPERITGIKTTFWEKSRETRKVNASTLSSGNMEKVQPVATSV
jgi:hypothetical protein